MNEKDEQLLKEIKRYYNKNKAMPTVRYLQNILLYKSTNSIFRKLKKMENLGYLSRNDIGKLTINESLLNYESNFKKIKIINRNNKYINIILNKRNSYIAYQLNNNYLEKYGLIKNDILIIQKNKEINNNDFGLFIINNKKRIMKCHYINGFYVLNDYEEVILNKIKLLGKVILIERKI